MRVILSKNFDESTQIIGFILLKIGRDYTAHKNGLKGRKNILTYAVKQMRKKCPYTNVHIHKLVER